MVLNLAADLTAKGLKGLLISALTDFRRFYRTYSGISQTLSVQLGPALPPDHLLRLSWSHIIELVRSGLGRLQLPPFEQLSVG